MQACYHERNSRKMGNKGVLMREFGLRNDYSTPRKAGKHPSSVDETQKMVKISFPPRLKLKKRQKPTFRHGG